MEKGWRRKVSRREEEVVLKKQLRDIEKFTDMDQMFRDSQKEKWKGRFTRD